MCATAIQAINLLPIGMKDEIVDVRSLNWWLAGRFEVRRDCITGRSVIFDVAHNPAAMEQLAARVQRYKDLNPELGRVAVVLAMMADKDVLGMITALEYCVDIWYIAQVDQARSMAADEVAQTMKGVGIGRDRGQIFQFDSVQSAYRAACAETEGPDSVLVTGSFLTVAAVHGLSEQA